MRIGHSGPPRLRLPAIWTPRAGVSRRSSNQVPSPGFSSPVVLTTTCLPACWRFITSLRSWVSPMYVLPHRADIPGSTGHRFFGRCSNFTSPPMTVRKGGLHGESAPGAESGDIALGPAPAVGATQHLAGYDRRTNRQPRCEDRGHGGLAEEGRPSLPRSPKAVPARRGGLLRDDLPVRHCRGLRPSCQAV